MTKTDTSHTSVTWVRSGGQLGPHSDTHEPDDERRVRRARAVAALRAGVGAFCLLAPQRALVASERDSPAARRVMRILGGRHLLQAGVELVRPSPVVLILGAGVDAIHALTCLGFVVIGDARWRHGVLVNAAAATGFSAATAATARTTRPRTPPAPAQP